MWLSPRLYSLVYEVMAREGHKSVKQTIREGLLTAAKDKALVERARQLAVLRHGMKEGNDG